MTLVQLDEIVAAAARLSGVALRTPLLPAAWAHPGRPLLLKPESLQPVGAFKIRGAYNAIAQIPPADLPRGVVTHSSGNHAQAVAFAARAFGIPATIVIPHGAPAVKVAATEALGATVVRVPAAERASAVAAIAADSGMTPVPPYDHPAVIAGQGTVGLEIAADLPDVGVVLVPVSGGGLLAGVAAAIKARCPDALVVGVEPALAGDARESLRSGRLVEWSPADTGRTIADGLRVAGLGALPWEHVRVLVDDIVTVSEDQILDAVRLLAVGSRLVVEPSGAVTVAAYLAGLKPTARSTVAVVSGGNIDPSLLATVLAREPVQHAAALQAGVAATSGGASDERGRGRP